MVDISVGWGEFFDRLTILEIKISKCHDLMQRQNLEQSLHVLSHRKPNTMSEIVQNYIGLLRDINQKLWTVEDEIRIKEHKQEFDEMFVALARSVYQLNDQRHKIKRNLDIELDSKVHDIKIYTSAR